MAYKIEKRGEKWVVVKKATGEVVPGGDHARKPDAVNHIRALYASIKDVK